MKLPGRTSIIAVALLAAGACADADTGAEEGTAADTAAELPQAADAGMEGTEAAAAAETVLLNPNDASADELRAAGLSDAAVAALTGGRPFADMLAVDAALAGALDEASREAAYREIWIPLDLNEASREEILLIPGVGDRMAGEFEEYRPYEAMAESRREIGKYVDDAEVERLAGYVTLE